MENERRMEGVRVAVRRILHTVALRSFTRLTLSSSDSEHWDL